MTALETVQQQIRGDEVTPAPRPSQQKAIEFFERFLQRECSRSNVAALQVTNWRVRQFRNSNLIFISAQLECGPSVSANSMLRAVSHEWWHVCIHSRGGVEVLSAP